MKKDYNKNIQEIYRLLKEGHYNYPPIILGNIYKDLPKDHKYRYLKGVIRENIYESKIDNETKDIKEKYINLANKLIIEEKYDLALYAYHKGHKLTRDHEFYYLIGKLYYCINNNEKAREYLNNYLNSYGSKYFEETYSIFYNIISQTIEKKEAVYEKVERAALKNSLKKLNKKLGEFDVIIRDTKLLKKGIFSAYRQKTKDNLYKIDTDDIEIQSIINSGKLNDVQSVFEEANYEKKITILAMLYLNGFDKFADKMLKGVKEELKQNNPKGINALNKNKTLYISKSKFNKR